MKHINLMILAAVLLTGFSLITCNQTRKYDEKEKLLTEKEKQLLNNTQELNQKTGKLKTDKKQSIKQYKALEYALTYDSKKGSVCLLGKHRIGISVAIVNVKEKSVLYCKTVAVKSEISQIAEYYFGGDKLIYTTLDKQPSENHILDCIGILNFNANNFEIMEANVNNDKTVITKIDSLIEHDKSIKKLPKDHFDYLSKENSDLIKRELPIVYDVNTPDFQFKIVLYPAFPTQYYSDRPIEGSSETNASTEYTKDEDGPRFAIINSKIFCLTMQGSREFMVYKFDNRIFINSPLACGGWNASQIFELKDDAVKRVFYDDSYSD